MHSPVINDLAAPQTVSADDALDVRQRLTQLQTWKSEWQHEDALLKQRLYKINPDRSIELQQATQIANLRRRVCLHLVRQPLEISSDTVKSIGYPALRQHLVAQFVGLTQEERLLWLNNFLFIVTPELRQLNNKIANLRGYQSFGQQRNFLLGGPSGVGKTTYLNWFTLNYMPRVEVERNHVPVAKIDAPVNNRTANSLLQRIIMACGMNYNEGDNEDTLLKKVILFLQTCDVDTLIIDEIEHITCSKIRRRLLEISNLSLGLTMICASCNPQQWVDGDVEVAGRWNDKFTLKPYTGQRLSQLLAFLELLLPFSSPSSLASYELKTGPRKSDCIPGPAQLIEQYTGGILRDIMLLIMDASRRAIRESLPRLSPSLLEQSWRDIQTRQVTDIFALLQRNGGQL